MALTFRVRDYSRFSIVTDEVRVQSLVRERMRVEAPKVAADEYLGLFADSSHLRPNVDAMAQNVGGFGWSCRPVFRVESANDQQSQEAVAQALFVQRLREAADAPGDDDAAIDAVDKPTDAEVVREIEKLLRHQLLDAARLQRFLARVSLDETWTELRKRTIADLEVTGNGFWEVMRNKQRQPARFRRLSARTHRLTDCERTKVMFRRRVREGLMGLSEPLEYDRYPRMIVQLRGGRAVLYYKEFGDPRLINATNGEVFAQVQDEASESAARAQGIRIATECKHFRIYDPAQEPYGAPRWSGVRRGIAGSIKAEKINEEWFADSMGPGMLVVANAELATDQLTAIKTSLSERKRGRYNQIPIVNGLKADPAVLNNNPHAAGSAPHIEWISFNEYHRTDQVYGEYVTGNGEKARQSFRHPPLVVGIGKDFNRATAETSMRMANQQVWDPERDDFDDWMNLEILPELNISTVLFESRGPNLISAEDHVKLVNDSLRSGGLRPQDARIAYGDSFGEPVRPLDPEEHPWVEVPPPYAKVLDQARAAPRPQQSPKAAEKPEEQEEPDEEQDDL